MLRKVFRRSLGDGVLTGESGATGEPDLFGHPNAWMDYSGPVYSTEKDRRESHLEGITYFDHPANPTYPSKWHVREDGWMGASACRDQSIIIERMEPLRLRYLLHIHSENVDIKQAEQLAANWHKLPMQHVVKSTAKHQQFALEPVST